MEIIMLCLPGFALFCRHLVLAVVGDWILGEMDSLADQVILVYFGILLSSKMQMEKTAQKCRCFIQNSSAPWILCRESAQQKGYSA